MAEAMAKINPRTVASLLKEYAQRASMRGDNPYRIKAYLRAADSLTALSQPLDRIIAAGALTNIPGIGDAIADIVTKLYQTGTHPSLEKLREDVPAGVMELFAIPGLRPDKILKLHQALGVNSLAEPRPQQEKTAYAQSKASAPRFRQSSCRTWPSCEAAKRNFTCTRPPLFSNMRSYR
ncbi:hypothetical protein [Mesorhizobium sp. M1399]|uniref:hypothetical protein n=1 Tax=Mesorhizobium sp. M1399 TaxID=2957096 RepID=UPI0033398836